MEISFNTPVIFQNPTLVQSIVETIDDCFSLGSPAVTVVGRLGNCYCVQPLNESESAPVSIYKRIAKCVFATLTIIPLLIKCIYRATHTFERISIEQLNQLTTMIASSEGDKIIEEARAEAVKKLTSANLTEQAAIQMRDGIHQAKKAAEIEIEAFIKNKKETYQQRAGADLRMAKIQIQGNQTEREKRLLLLLQNPTTACERIQIQLPSTSAEPLLIDTYRYAVEQCECLKMLLRNSKLQARDPLINLSEYPPELLTQENIHILLQFVLGEQINITCTMETLSNLWSLANMLIYPAFEQAILSLINDLLTDVNITTTLSTAIEQNQTELVTCCLQFLARTNRWIFTLPAKELAWIRETLELVSEDNHCIDQSWAQVTLGRLYWLGQGVQKNRITAQEWFTKAAEANNPRGHAWLGFYYNYQGLHNKAHTHIQQASDLNDGFGHALLGDQASLSNKKTLYQKSADLQEPYGMKQLYITDPNQNQLLLKALESMDAAAHNTVGLFYWGGKQGYVRDRQKAFEYFTLSALYQTSSDGIFNLAECYELGEGTAPNRELAIHYYTEAAELGHPKAKSALLRLIQ